MLLNGDNTHYPVSLGQILALKRERYKPNKSGKLYKSIIFKVMFCVLRKIFIRNRQWIFKEFLKMEEERLRIGKIKLTQIKNIIRIIAKEYKYKLYFIFNDMKLLHVKILLKVFRDNKSLGKHIVFGGLDFTLLDCLRILRLLGAQKILLNLTIDL